MRVRQVKEVRIKEIQTEADEASFWLNGFSNKGVKDLIFAQSLGFLNDKLLRYSNAITGGKISVEIHRDLSVGVDIRDGAKGYQTASGGQARRIDLMIGLALQSLVEAGWKDVNVKIIDEFDASLDKEGVDGFLSLLREEAKQKNSIYIISHNDYVAEQLDQVIHVELEDGESKIITEGV
jgi:DNA repair exonuclease SbcCD ATPase subunit